MAKITTGGSGSGISPSSDVTVNSLHAVGEVSAAEVNADAINIENTEQTQGAYTDETGTRWADTGTSKEILATSDGLKFDGGSVITVDHADAAAAANSPSTENPFATIADAGGTSLSADIVAALEGANIPSALNPFATGLDSAQPMAHGASVHSLGVQCTEDQVTITPASYTGNLAGVTGEEPVISDLFGVFDGLTILPAEIVNPRVRIDVPYAYDQIAAETSVALAATTDMAAIGFIERIDLGLVSLSLRIAGVTAQGNLVIKAHEAGTALYKNGLDNLAATNSAPVMTTDALPSPYATFLVDTNGTNAFVAGYEPFKAFNGSIASDDGVKTANFTGYPFYLWLDLGTNPLAVNAFDLVSFNNATRGFPKGITCYGTNTANPTKNSTSGCTQLVTSASLADPGQGKRWRMNFDNATAYRWYLWKITDYVGTAMFSLSAIYLYAVQNGVAPSLSSPVTLGTVDSGAGAGWIRATFSVHQLNRKKRHFITASPAAGVSVSISAGRTNATHGSEPPEQALALTSTDSGTSWKNLYLDAYNKGYFNCVLNSNSNHAPLVHLGRAGGQYLPVWDGTAWVLAIVPVGALTIECGALTALSEYDIVGYLNAGNLAITSSQTARGDQDGIQIISGTPAQRIVGRIKPITRNTSVIAPIQVADRLEVSNLLCKELLRCGKGTPYSGATTWTTAAVQVPEKVGSGDLKITFICADDELIRFSAFGLYSAAASYLNVSFGVDDFAYSGATGVCYGLHQPSMVRKVSVGSHEVALLAWCMGLGFVTSLMLWNNGGYGVPPMTTTIDGVIQA